MPTIGCYALDLYCDHDHGNDLPTDNYHGHTYSECAKQARKNGWTIHANGMASCPSCKGKPIPTTSAVKWYVPS